MRRAKITYLSTVAFVLVAAGVASAQPAAPAEPVAPIEPAPPIEPGTPVEPTAMAQPAAPEAMAQPAAPPRPVATRPPIGPVFEVQGFGLVPLGDWSRHVYETAMPGLSLQQFGPGAGGAITMGLRNVPAARWDLLLRAHYGVLGTGAWERYAAAHGSNVSTSARLANVGLLMTRDIDVSETFLIAVGGGPGVAWGSGEESDPATTTYPYTMLKTVPSLSICARGILALSPVFSVVAELSGLVGASIVSYGAGDDRMLTALVGGVGIRMAP